MSWADVDLTNVNPNSDPVPAGTYLLTLLPGSKYEGSQIKCAAAISEGEQNGRYVFFSYPDPTDFDWAPKALKVFEIALGVDATPGEDPVAYLNRAANNRFMGTVKHREYENKAGGKGVSVDLQLFQMKPAA